MRKTARLKIPAGTKPDSFYRQVAHLLAQAPGPHTRAAAAVAERARQVLRPAGALARLDELAEWLAAWQGTERPAVRRPAALVFAADHGVAAAGVSAYPAEVTAAMVKALREGVATACVLARQVGATLEVVDVGVGVPTGDLTREPALDPARFRACVQAGRDAVAALDTDLLVLGEMGIGNTTAAAAVTAILLGRSAEASTGRGTGVDDAGLARKRRQADTPGVFQMYASGCSGNVTAGKYNDGDGRTERVRAERLRCVCSFWCVRVCAAAGIDL